MLVEPVGEKPADPAPEAAPPKKAAVRGWPGGFSWAGSLTTSTRAIRSWTTGSLAIRSRDWAETKSSLRSISMMAVR